MVYGCRIGENEVSKQYDNISYKDKRYILKFIFL